MIKFLNKPYPLPRNWRISLLYATLIATFVTLFLYIYKPFQTDIHPSICSFKNSCYYGLITLANITFVDLFFPNILYNEKKWTTGKEFLHILLIVFFITVSNFIFENYYFQNIKMKPLNHLFFSIYTTTSVAVFPAFAIITINQYRLLKQNTLTASQLNQKNLIENMSSSITINGAGKNEQLLLPAYAFLYAEANANYTEIGYEQDNKLNKILLRSNIGNIEKQLNHNGIVRVHRGYLVNLNRVSNISGNAQGLKLHLPFNQDIPVSRNKIEAVKTYMN